MEPCVIKSEERAIFALRSLYRKYGYTPYKMSKFEEYEYYIRNKDFLISDRVIPFQDTNGRLLALKPDVTLSIVKNCQVMPGCKQKVYYNENIYRISETTGQYKEIMQAGLECIGDIDLYDIYEVVSLAAESLAQISGEFILQISHLGILSAVLNHVCKDQTFQQNAIGCISCKNSHDLYRLCDRYGLSKDQTQLLTEFTHIYGDRKDVLLRMESLYRNIAEDAMEELRILSDQLDRLPNSHRIIFDFSVVNNMSYYNGIMFTGFVNGISDGILAGGQYDKLMHKLGHKTGAIGFALYLDLLEQLRHQKHDYDVDVLLLYSQTDDLSRIAQVVDGLTGEGKTVSAQRSIPANLRYRTIMQV